METEAFSMTKVKTLLRYSIILSIAILGLPILLLKTYSTNDSPIPDILIYGALITGKDINFSGINFAYKFQLSFIMLFLLLTALAYAYRKRKKIYDCLIIFNCIILCLFPVWLWLYTLGIIDNSDGIHMAVIPHIGSLAYLLIIFIYIKLLFIDHPKMILFFQTFHKTSK